MPLRMSRPRASGYVAMAAALAICGWLIATYDGSSSLETVKIGRSAGATTTPSAPSTGTKYLSAGQLGARAAAVGHPVYWAGEESGVRYDLQRASGGVVLVRYLPGVSESESLRVATIPYANAYDATKGLAAKPGASSKVLPNGSLVYYREGRPATYVVFPGAEYVIEVDAPSAAQARQAALSGRIQPVG